VNNCEEAKTIEEALAQNGIYTGLTTGSSMEPLIHNQKDTVIIVKPKERLKKYDVPVYVLPSGKYVMHRVIEVYDDHYLIVGDNLLTRENVTDDMIIGKLVGFYKNGKNYIDLEKNRGYQLYSKIWVALLPVRRFVLIPNRALKKAKRLINRIIKRG
jgi:hypothetical protein